MRKLLIIFLACTGFYWSYGQSQDIYTKYNIYRNPFRVFLNKFSWTVTTGYGLTNYKHELNGFYFYQDEENQFILNNQEQPGDVFQGYGGWLSQPYLGEQMNLDDPYDLPYNPIENPVNNPNLVNSQFLADTDTLDLSFSSVASTIPVLASVHYHFGEFRIGAGFQYERHFINPLKPSVNQQQIREYQPSFKQTSYTKIFGMLGYRFYEWWDYTFALEVQMGRAKAGKEINTNALAIGQNFFTNIGINIEHNWSEYFRVVVRPSYDIKSYVINLPEGSSIRHNNAAFMVQVGVSINIPEIPRSPMKSDHVQLKHVITDPKTGRLMEVRGQPIWNEQNPKVGENHRRLWRYKWRNKRKFNPY